jgi:Zn-dependent protease
MKATFRPRLSGLTMKIGGATFLAWLLLGRIEIDVVQQYPFAFACLAGMLMLWHEVNQRADRGLTVTETGLHDHGTQATLGWAEVDRIDLQIAQATEDEGVVFRFAEVRAGSEQVAFGAIDYLKPDEIHDLPASPTVLAIVAAQTEAEALYPPSWRADSPVPAADEDLDVQPIRSGNAGAGLLALGVKLLPKLGGIVVKLLKTVKPAAAIATIGVYSVVFSWEFAMAAVVVVGIHECGHIWAMWRSGVEVKGLYLLPFFGGAAVSKGVASTRAASAYIAINGPIWGTVFAIVCLAGWAVTDSPMLAALAGWGALINLFNLLPVFPLDGGRIFSSLAYTALGGVGTGLVLVSLLGGAALGYFGGLELLTLLSVIGLLEWAGQLEAAPYAPALALLGDRPFGPEEHKHFHGHVRRVYRSGATPESVDARADAFRELHARASMTPMTTGQALLLLAGWGGLVLLLLGIVWLVSDVPGIGEPLSLLQ